MPEIELKSGQIAEAPPESRTAAPAAGARERTRPRRRILPVLITLAAIVLAVPFVWAMWSVYMSAPWTRDGTVRVYVVTIAPEVTGRIVQLPVADNQLVHKGDLLMVIDPTNYKIAVSLAEAAAQQAQVNAQNADREAKRRAALSNLAVAVEEQQNFEAAALAAQAQHEQAEANLDQARVNLDRTEIRAPVNGWVTNLLAQLGNYATAGQNQISIVNADSFWVDGYFEEGALARIHEGDPARVKLMGRGGVLSGHVDSISRGINVPNAQPDSAGLASVNPIFTWVRLAQRVPVRIHIDAVPPGVQLVAGMTATVEIEPRATPAAGK